MMKYRIVIQILIFATGLLVCSCQRELSCEGSGCLVNYDDGQAAYAWLQTNGDCAHSVLQGNFKQGIALNDSNAVAIDVNVTKVGAYLFKTDTVNGFYFIGQGIFSDTGLVTVVLKGAGKPFSAGDYHFITGASSGCRFIVNVDSNVAEEKYFYDFKLNGVRHMLTLSGTDGLKNSIDAAINGGLSNGTIILYSNGGTTSQGLYISKGNTQPSDLTENGLAAYFAIGSYPYSGSKSFKDIVIWWREKKDEIWNSNNLPGTQNGSSFMITSVETYMDTMGRPIAKVKASFNCILYDQNGGAMPLTEGKFYGEFANILR